MIESQWPLKTISMRLRPDDEQPGSSRVRALSAEHRGALRNGSRRWPRVLLAASLLVVVATLYLWIDARNPPGFYRDEASLALTAAAIAETGRDEYGARFPLFFEQRGDFRSPVQVYALAGVFVLTGPSNGVARALGAALGLATVLVVAFLAWRLSNRLSVALAVGTLAGLVPWLFEVTRVAFECASTQLAFALVLLAVYEGSRRDRWPKWLSVATGLALTLLTLSYSTGRVYGPLLAAGLAILATRSRLAGLGLSWAVFALTALLPIAMFSERHPGALSARFHEKAFVEEGMSKVEIVGTFLRRYARQLDLWTWTFGGDSNTRHHVQGVGSLLITLTALALVGLVIVAVRARRDRFWRLFLLALAVVPIPVASTVDDYHALRTAVLPLCLCVLAVPAVDWLFRHLRTSLASRVLVAALILLAIGQTAWFQVTYWRDGPDRYEAFESGVDNVVKTALHQSVDGRVYFYLDDKRARTQLQWNALLLGRREAAVPVGEGNAAVPPGGVVFTMDHPCTGCRLLSRSGAYAAFFAPGLLRFPRTPALADLGPRKRCKKQC